MLAGQADFHVQADVSKLPQNNWVRIRSCNPRFSCVVNQICDQMKSTHVVIQNEAIRATNYTVCEVNFVYNTK